MKVLSLLLAALSAYAGAPPGRDLRLSYRSSIDNTEQPYRLYIPASYRAGSPAPLVFVLHGTDWNENAFFDESRRYPKDGVQNAAEKYGALAVCPRGRGNTEYRGIGENDVFCVLEEVRKRFRIDEDRIYLTGHSMGGSGSAYLGLHHPDLFAAAAPLASPYSFPWIAANARHLPFWWIGGAADEEFYRIGVAAGVERMRRLNCPVLFTDLAGEGHFGPAQDFDQVFAWLLKHRRMAHPEAFTFEVDTPLHGRAYWATVENIAQPGRVARVEASAGPRNEAHFKLHNISAVSFWPDPEIFDLKQPVRVTIANTAVFTGRVSSTQQVALERGPAGWKADVRTRREMSLTAYRNHPVAFAPESLDMNGTEAPLANWITDAMRAATGAELAVYNRRAYRGLPIPAGTVDMVDLIQCSRPFDQYLVTVRLKGRDLVEIFDANIQDLAAETKRGLASNYIVQVSGARYAFDRRLAPGRRIVSHSLDLDRTYTVALEGQVVERDTIRLAGRFKKLDYKTTDMPFTLALYAHAARSRVLRPAIEGRVREIR